MNAVCTWVRPLVVTAGPPGQRPDLTGTGVRPRTGRRHRCRTQCLAGSVVIMAVTTSFTELVGCRVPIQQAPMGSVSTSPLAVAVADAGGVGGITALGLTAADLDKVLAGLTARTAGVLAANFLTRRIDPEAVAAAAARVRIVDFLFAVP